MTSRTLVRIEAIAYYLVRAVSVAVMTDRFAWNAIVGNAANSATNRITTVISVAELSASLSAETVRVRHLPPHIQKRRTL